MRGTFIVLALSLSLCGTLAAVPALAASALRFSPPPRLGEIPAVTYDADGHPIGRARLAMTRTGEGLRINVETTLDNGERSSLSAAMRRLDDGRFQLVSQSARTFDAHGVLTRAMDLDHVHARGRCRLPSGEVRTVALPAHDRIANVPLNLLLRPLVTGAEQRVRFQTFVCGDTVRIVDTEASRVGPPAGERSGLVEVRYRFDLGLGLSLLARPFLPRIRFWFDAQRPNVWVGYRLPLYSDGPTVLVLRNGVNPAELSDGG
jgi:hypothetical protein